VFHNSNVPDTAVATALAQLQIQFSEVPERILIAVLRGYLEREQSLARATAATRRRIIGACAVR
jgi:hypothetical protein